MNKSKMIRQVTPIKKNFLASKFCLLFIALFLFIFAKVAFADTIVPGGNITANTTWALSGSPYIVQGNVTVTSGTTLTIEPGVTVKFAGFYELKLQGVLNAQGTAQNRIKFMSNRPIPGTLDWTGLVFDGLESSSSIINYWQLEHGVNALTLRNGASPVITQILATNNNTAFSFNNASPNVTYVSAWNNGSGFIIQNGASPVINYSLIYSNSHGVNINPAGGLDPNPIVNQSSIRNNAFNVIIVGPYSNPSAILNFKENWWGTVSTTTINNTITDHHDNASFPYVHYGPPLNGENGSSLPGTWFGGLIPNSITWPSSGNPYIAFQNTTVPSSVTLTIQPGVSVKVDGNYQLQVIGKMVALGTSQSYTTFKSNKPNPGPQDWMGIIFNGPESSDSQAAYWQIENATNGFACINNASPAVSNVTAVNNNTAFNFNNSSPIVINIIATNNGSGFIINNAASPIITNSLSYGNYHGVSLNPAGGGDPNPVIQDSSIYGNAYNVFSAAAYNNPNLVLNFEENWWGTTDAGGIEASIVHHNDNPSLPFVDFIPYHDSQGTSVGGVISKNTTWTFAGSPYIVQETVTVIPGVVLTIDPGVVVKFNGFYSLDVHGILNTQGTSTNRIIFTSNQSNATPGNWNRILLMGTESSGSTLSYCDIRYAAQALYLNNSSPAMTAVDALHNNTAFLLTGNSSPQISSSSTLDNEVGFLIQGNGQLDPNPAVHESSIYGNSLFNVTMIGDFQDPDAVLDFENNWWGTTDSQTIESSIWHHQDNSLFPYIDFVPFMNDTSLKIIDVSRFPTALDHQRGETVSISYSLSKEANVMMEIFNEMSNQLVKTLVNNQPRTAGVHHEIWDGRNNQGSVLPYEAYYFRITAVADGNTVQFIDQLVSTGLALYPYAENVSFNPYQNERLRIHYTVPNLSRQSVRILNRQTLETVRTVVTTEPKLPGERTDFWDGRNDQGNFYQGLYDVYFDHSILLHKQAIVLKSSFDIPITNFKSEAYLFLPPYDEITTISYDLSVLAQITIVIRDASGNYVKALVQNESQMPANYQFIWDGKNDLGEIVVSEGVYQVRITATDPNSGTSTTITGNVTVY